MSTHLTVVYEAPSDPARFVERYRDEHMPLATEVFGPHGLSRWSVSRTERDLGGDAPSVALVVTLTFDAPADAVAAALATEPAQEVYAHALSLTDAPVHSYLGEGQEVTVG